MFIFKCSQWLGICIAEEILNKYITHPLSAQSSLSSIFVQKCLRKGDKNTYLFLQNKYLRNYEDGYLKMIVTYLVLKRVKKQQFFFKWDFGK